MIRLFFSPLAPVPHPRSKQSNGALVSNASWMVPQLLPGSGDLADKAALTRPCASVGVTCLVGCAAWRHVAGEAVRGPSNALPERSRAPPPLWRARGNHQLFVQRTCATGRCTAGHLRLLGLLPGVPWPSLGGGSGLLSRARALRERPVTRVLGRGRRLMNTPSAGGRRATAISS